MDIEPDNSGFSLDLTSPNEAGDGIKNQTTNATKWINFTSAVDLNTSRKISAQLSGATLSGLDLKLGISHYSGSGAGTLGSSISSIILGDTPQTIINGIGGAYTGDGIYNGYNLIYSLEVADFSMLRNASKSFSIVFTMTDN
ncbi:hypothetical protein DJ013_12140 [Arcticibacterium luteifluviistationis]|uniref:Uncharacterized protein n=2 Tax=Arcticibacterium luteifluviistationis TaxID=1784714 RepID=A0A2Z4GCI1_9BACT|nr:hypothetical protein DJ013_12140 [Arcticibacterium luteifluviistationis]